MTSAHILVVEDDHHILMGLVDTLESEGYRTTAARNGKEALDLLSGSQFDLVLLDIMMGEKSGYDVCRVIRADDEQIPIIFLTAKGEEIDKVVGFELGADDYITKPFGVRELLARIAAVLRRTRRPPQRSPEPSQFRFGAAWIDTLQYSGRLGDKTFSLSAREVRLLRFFARHPNQVLGREAILDAVWGIKYFGTTRTLDQHVAQLRKKVESDPTRPSVIVTVHGVGYRYEAREANGAI